jgi:hypothetical protein
MSWSLFFVESTGTGIRISFLPRRGSQTPAILTQAIIGLDRDPGKPCLSNPASFIIIFSATRLPLARRPLVNSP